MPRPPPFTVLHKKAESNGSAVNTETGAIVPANGLAFPVICKPVEACGEWWAPSLRFIVVVLAVLLLVATAAAAAAGNGGDGGVVLLLSSL